jgi:zinc D-Ala-D-Ala carboxypeptidase
MNLSTHFTLEEFTFSETAVRKSIDNSLPDHLLPAARDTAALMERIRDALNGQPITVTSGYRCMTLNRAIGSGDGSDHPDAVAVDFKCPGFGTPYEVCKRLAGLVDELGIGQLIHEYGRWIHVSTRHPAKAINRIITISNNGTQAGIQKV